MNPIWFNDAFELFIRPGPDKPGYYEFEVNAANAVFDAFYPKVDIPNIIKHIKHGEFRVVDLGSLNGTYVNRQPVPSAVLANGDEIQIGKFRLVFLTRPTTDPSWSA